MKAIGSAVGSIMPWKANMRCCSAAPLFYPFLLGLSTESQKSNSSVDLVATFGCLGRVVGRNQRGEGFLEPLALARFRSCARSKLPTKGSYRSFCRALIPKAQIWINMNCSISECWFCYLFNTKSITCMESGSWPFLINDWLVSRMTSSHPWFLGPTIGRLWSRAPGPDSSQQCTSDPSPTVQQSWIGRVRPSFQQRPDMSIDDRLVMWVDLYRLIMLQCSGTFLARFIYIFHTPHPCASNLGAPKVPQETWKSRASILQRISFTVWPDLFTYEDFWRRFTIAIVKGLCFCVFFLGGV